MYGNQYRCVATNAIDSATSNAAVLTVIPPRPAGFDAVGYMNLYPDLFAAYGGLPEPDRSDALWIQYWTHGIDEGRILGNGFNAAEYLALYPDLQAAFGANLREAVMHWLLTGQTEGRMGSIPAGFDADGYLACNSDLEAAFGSLPQASRLAAAWNHYWNQGIDEGRYLDHLFRANDYLELNPDLRAAFGTDLHEAVIHWLYTGQSEGRMGCIPPAFDANAYLACNGDLAAAFGSLPEPDRTVAAWLHYWNQGIAEGRYLSKDFRANDYLALYADLRAAFGSDLHQAVLHWLWVGEADGRLGYIPPTFDAAGYLACNGDLEAAFGSLPEPERSAAAWMHYWDRGIDEGRYLDSKFRAQDYLELNPDLAAAFGTDLHAAVMHWLNTGQFEGRVGRLPGT